MDNSSTRSSVNSNLNNNTSIIIRSSNSSTKSSSVSSIKIGRAKIRRRPLTVTTWILIICPPSVYCRIPCQYPAPSCTFHPLPKSQMAGSHSASSRTPTITPVCRRRRGTPAVSVCSSCYWPPETNEWVGILFFSLVLQNIFVIFGRKMSIGSVIFNALISNQDCQLETSLLNIKLKFDESQYENILIFGQISFANVSTDVIDGFREFYTIHRWCLWLIDWFGSVC